MATAEPGARIARFTLAERLMHWLLAAAFAVLLGTGLLMSVPALEGIVPRPVAKAWHIDAAIGLAAGVLVITLARARVIGRTIGDLERFDRDDGRWLAQIPRRITVGAPAPPQGRFNAGQKLNTAVVAGLMVVSYITGFLLWYGERNTAYRFAGTINVHDDVMWLLMILVIGHLYMALVNPEHARGDGRDGARERRSRLGAAPPRQVGRRGRSGRRAAATGRPASYPPPGGAPEPRDA